MTSEDKRETPIGNDINSVKTERLIAALGSDDHDTRRRTIAELQSSDKSAVAPMLRALNSENPDIRSGSAEVLSGYGEALMPTFIRILTTGKENARDGAARAIGRCGKSSLRYIEEIINDNDYRKRRGAVQALGYLGEKDPSVTEILTAFLYDKNEKVSLQSAKSLKYLKWKPQNKMEAAAYFYASGEVKKGARYPVETVSVAVRDFKNPDVQRRKKAAKHLSEINSEIVIQPLAALLQDNSDEVRYTAIKAISNINERRFVPYLVKAMEDKNSNIRNEAAWGLDRYGWKPRTYWEKTRYLIIKEKWIEIIQLKDYAIPVLIEYLCDENPAVRLKVTEVLKAMGKPGYSAINEALKSENPLLRKRAAEAAAIIKNKISGQKSGGNANIKNIPGQENIEEEMLRRREDLKDKGLKSSDAWNLILTKSGIRPFAAERLSKALSSENEMVRSSAAEKLAGMDSVSEEPLLHLLKDRKNSVKIAAIESLGELKSKKSVPHLVNLLRYENRSTCITVIEALGKIKDPESVIPMLKISAEGDSELKNTVSAAVSGMETAALPTLKDALEGNNSGIRVAAIEALAGIKHTISIRYAVRMLNDSDSQVRESAVNALKDMSDFMFNNIMDESGRLATQGTAPEKTGIIEALSRINDLRAKQAILPFTKDKNETVRKKACARMEQSP
ncbi:HEAT repeat domain-containing protein [Methanoplanus endosymbiosus]|uniref:HEAT repeat domain-containing protein n=1 Tax=Methanoplanus endosymbiosus TaxID=33865 RepID=A0A9E7PNF7_9EURY|nr:HEAT repeat domain-containing protein [Methanoplanus endosymbiosus]UUX93499.1 HEAT repeat domain-containing protein [Methanoplanus endosymbiosus]